jgi:arsenate reductase
MPETTLEGYRSGIATMLDRALRLQERRSSQTTAVATMNRFAKATIFHNPMCGTSRKTLDILRESGRDVWIREYLKDPPGREELRAIYDRAGISPREGLRAKEPLAAELGLTAPDVDDDTILDAMIEHPILIERPLVETEKGVRLCRPQDKVREIL